jgi:hypothetical protein
MTPLQLAWKGQEDVRDETEARRIGGGYEEPFTVVETAVSMINRQPMSRFTIPLPQRKYCSYWLVYIPWVQM